jgi:hypothetical protein
VYAGKRVKEVLRLPHHRPGQSKVDHRFPDLLFAIRINKVFFEILLLVETNQLFVVQTDDWVYVRCSVGRKQGRCHANNDDQSCGD